MLLPLPRDTTIASYGPLQPVYHKSGSDTKVSLLYVPYVSEAPDALDFYADFGMQHVLELEVLTRFHHPYLLHAEGLIYDAVYPVGLAIQLPMLTYTYPHGHMTKDMGEFLRSMLYKITLALNFLHQHHILHLNMSMACIAFAGSTPVLCDFARARRISMSTSTAVVEGGYAIDTEAEDPCYDLLYRPPENLKSNLLYTYKSDVWALGITILRLICDIEHFGGNATTPEDMYKWINTHIRPSQIRDWLAKSEIKEPYRRKALNLLTLMLERNVEARLSMRDVLAHPFFSRETRVRIPQAHVDLVPRVALRDERSAPHLRSYASKVLAFAEIIDEDAHYLVSRPEAIFLGLDILYRTVHLLPRDLEGGGDVDSACLACLLVAINYLNPWDPLESTCRHASLSIL